MSFPTSSTPGHAFISYVREDAEHVDRLQELLEAAGVAVWRDTENLWPGQDWRIEIRRAITTGSLAFIACFSENSQAREQSYQNEELLLAVEQLRRRAPGKQWLFPVRFAECELPAFDLGAGRTLDDLQRSDLFGDRRDVTTTRLITAVVRLLDSSPSTGNSQKAYADDPAGFMKTTLLDPKKRIQLDDFVTTKVQATLQALGDQERFPVNTALPQSNVERVRYVASRAEKYFETVEPLISILTIGCRWGGPEHYPLWTRLLSSVANRPLELGGDSSLVELQRFPVIPALYAGALAAVSRGDFGALKAIAVDPLVRRYPDKPPVPLVSAAHPYRIFPDAGEAEAAGLLAHEASPVLSSLRVLLGYRRSPTYAPVSNYLFEKLQPRFVDDVPDEDDFADLFDLTELYLGLLAMDDLLFMRERGGYRDGAWYGRTTWRHPSSNRWGGPEDILKTEALSAGEGWAPLRAGLFGGSSARAAKALETFAQELIQVTSDRW
ncbi:TIR domain-containing protein [Geodermatophilus obscurus]|uniref:TIR domain-containing protein n=1 Tax=Geodermatophilus obscurus TaxID=1861 RepID=A0A1M7UZU7_9ACTN|nr:toll/interleukin-1 receptor domain-containing protein [Geodermatophilus obscurus]SHN88467.1 TIR domain-containing protein [Geodermatophilus obscurus]